MVPLTDKHRNTGARLLLALAICLCLGTIATAQELRLETPAERAYANKHFEKGADERSLGAITKAPRF